MEIQRIAQAHVSLDKATTDLDSKKSTMLVGKCFRFVILMIHLIV